MEQGKYLQKIIGALLIAAILQTSFAMSELFAARAAMAQGAAIDKAALTGTMLLPLVFVVLAVWARWAPAIAPVVATLFYAGILTFDTVVRRMPLGQAILVKILIVFALVRAVQIGFEYNRIRRQIAMGEAPPTSPPPSTETTSSPS